MNQREESPMGFVPIPKLLFKIAMPIIISMTIQALYNVIDSIFVAKISENALNAVSLAFPVQNALIAVAVGISVGMNAVLSRSLGEGNVEKANASALHTLFMAGIASLIFLFYGIFFSKSYFSGQTDVSEILAYGETYLLVISCWAFTVIYAITLERALQATGKTIYTMIAQCAGAIINIILDPIFIFGMFGFPRLEVLGAAYATVIGQTVCLSLNIYFNLKFNKELNFSTKNFVFSPKLVKEILSIAVPSMAMGMVTSFMVYGLNQIVMTFTVTATAVLGVYFKLQSFIFMPVYGLTNGMIPILAFNFGAKKLDRFMETLKLGLMTGTCIMIAGMFLFRFFPIPLMNLFTTEGANEEMLIIGEKALKIISVSFPCAGICVVLSAVFQSLGHGMLSLLAITLRQLVIQLPAAFVLSSTFGLTGTWYSFLLAETVSGCVMGFMLWKIHKNELVPFEKLENSKKI